MNAIFVANKPIFMSSNRFLSFLKRRDGIKQAGYSGTLDPFACGCLVVAYGSYTKLFPYLKKSPKVYRATLQLGLRSDSLDTENIIEVTSVKPFKREQIEEVFLQLVGILHYIPPKFSAKKIQGKKAYQLARDGLDFSLKECVMQIFYIKLLCYNHPFISFEVSVSEGGYVRSLGQIIAERLGCFGALSYLERLREGKFFYDNEKRLSLEHTLDLPKIRFKQEGLLSMQESFKNGRSISRGQLENLVDFSPLIQSKMELDLLINGKIKNGEYLVEFPEFFSMIRVMDDQIIYLLNRIPRC